MYDLEVNLGTRVQPEDKKEETEGEGKDKASEEQQKEKDGEGEKTKEENGNKSSTGDDKTSADDKDAKKDDKKKEVCVSVLIYVLQNISCLVINLTHGNMFAEGLNIETFVLYRKSPRR